MANLVLAFAELLGGAIVLDAAIKGDTIANVVRGVATQHPLSGSSSSATASAGGSPAAAVGAGASPAGDPFSAGATGSRLDQGQDLTSQAFLAPGAGTIVHASSSDPGWDGGGYIALKLDQKPAGLASDVIYFAEGILPTVKTGQRVNAGDTIGTPTRNPYNGIVGNIEWGLANPAAVTQPLAQVISNPAAMVQAFYKWALSIGAPKASSTGNAGAA